jgi:hypothetical protein
MQSGSPDRSVSLPVCQHFNTIIAALFFALLPAPDSARAFVAAPNKFSGFPGADGVIA